MEFLPTSYVSIDEEEEVYIEENKRVFIDELVENPYGREREREHERRFYESVGIFLNKYESRV